jgi:dihydrofolate reductase
MGGNTWRSIGSKPLPNRINLVISNTIPNSYKSVEDALEEAKKYNKPIFIIGGASIYEQTFKYAKTVYLTRINSDYNCDTFFPKKNLENMNCLSGDWLEYNGIIYRYEIYES